MVLRPHDCYPGKLAGRRFPSCLTLFIELAPLHWYSIAAWQRSTAISKPSPTCSTSMLACHTRWRGAGDYVSTCLSPAGAQSLTPALPHKLLFTLTLYALIFTRRRIQRQRNPTINILHDYFTYFLLAGGRGVKVFGAGEITYRQTSFDAFLYLPHFF